MAGLKIFLSRAKTASFRRFFQYAGIAAKEAGISPVRTVFDSAYCIFRYGVGYQDYRVFGFARRNAKQRKTYFTYGHNVAMTKKMNNPEDRKILDDKCAFLERFGQFLGRDWMDLRKNDANALAAFCVGKDSIFVKETDSFGGSGAAKIDVNEQTDFSALYEKLCNAGQYLVEDAICQHEEMNRLCAKSVNTVRIVTVTTPKGVEVAYALVRIGSGQKAVDNICAGGMYTVLDEKGLMRFPAFCDRDACYYEKHPVTGTQFAGFQIPCYKEAVDMCRKAARLVPGLRYIGWDVAITTNGPVLVEGNNFPGYDMAQNWRFCPDGTGLLPRMEQLAGGKIERA